MRHLKSVTYLLPFVLVSLYSASASAEIYRWVDDKGQTHFSSQPPEGNAQKAERYNVNVQRPAENVEGYKLPSWQTEDEEKPEAEPEAEKEQQTQADKEKAMKNCQRARDYKERVTTNFSRRFKQPDGEIRPLTDDERQREIEKANKLIEQNCK
ncbi:MAG: hypothetical protein CMI08_03055 [Oceanospirillaceae bacterium]|uniref:DUF4124 domain-containing protein n=1 Tax=unclassified Thalassolituus TaxID=2624967 RepID=UPI000C09334F|nr:MULTISPECIES: DUF4124 domain-containing protein [unclassified Thalassolituus]MAK90857.1 hypothetical protein [Thalassolituus sp.]MAS24594.1 hypothetical protein [Oceanospirillaceae bacterium]MAX98174.1 hypothetical protein [Oceanospirillaceae bacterium]MBL35761.1 hypothetical protein [Oceanospirillaceae bacterium]MBS52744.1 hypothetical protein [Oceanospirillaceae bacterium]|tara:strand:- start:140 stop:601 length:462 start_codon:yes stop_codon:yes gene_type:complete